MLIEDGTGTGNRAKVDAYNRLTTRAIIETEKSNATDNGDSYNFNSGLIAITATSGLLYFKNNEDTNFVIDDIAVGVGQGGTASDLGVITIIKNPTTGTVISNASAADINVNRNFASSNVITGLLYKGASGTTFTNGTDAAILYQGEGRLFASLGFELAKGDSIGIKYAPNLSAGTRNVYAAIVGFSKEA